MKRTYVVIVRDYDYRQCKPSDEYLKALDMYYCSPKVEMDLDLDLDKAFNSFDEKFREHFSHFLHCNYELIPV